MPAQLLDFALANDAAAATRSKLKKQSLLAQYLNTLDDADLPLAIRFAQGRPFAATDERVLNIGGAIVSEVVLSFLSISPAEFHRHIVQSGEIGEALRGLWPTTGRPSTLTLREIEEVFVDLSQASAAQTKKQLLRNLFSRCATGQEAAYLAKIIFKDLRTGVREGLLQAAVAEAFNQPLEQIQRCQLLIGDLDEVALLARHNRLGCAAFRLFHPIQFMLATPRQTPQEAADTLAGRPWWVEDKLDGIRAQIHKSGPRIALYTRTMDRVDDSFPDVVRSIRQLPGEFLLDGEIVPWQGGRVLPFAHIQKRLGRKKLSPRILAENPAAFIAFDLLYHEGQLLMDQPLAQRRHRLQQLIASAVSENSPATPPLISQAASVQTADQIAAAFEAARNRRNEGIVLKDPDSAYSPGRRGSAWLKLKTHLPTFDCIVTAAEYGHGKRKAVLSDYTFAVWDDRADPPWPLVNIGKAFSGLTDEEIRRLTEIFLRLSRRQVGRLHLVEPRIVLEIACDQIQQSNRHASGYALRFPRIKRIRWDKFPDQADRLSHLIELYQSTSNFARGHALPSPRPEPTLFDDLESPA